MLPNLTNSQQMSGRRKQSDTERKHKIVKQMVDRLSSSPSPVSADRDSINENQEAKVLHPPMKFTSQVKDSPQQDPRNRIYTDNEVKKSLLAEFERDPQVSASLKKNYSKPTIANLHKK